MRILFCSVLILCFVYLNAQENEGIKWTRDLTWEQIKDLAKEQDKFIFLDCYATWCGPCKKMDRETYLNKEVSDFINERFISVRVQVDTSKSDDEQIKNWYFDAQFITKEFKVKAFPTFLFFSPKGRIVHRDIGFKKVEQFIEVANYSLDSNTQYYTLLSHYKTGEKDYKRMKYLAFACKNFGDDFMAHVISGDYINNRLVNLPPDSLYTKENIQFISTFINSSRDLSFDLFVNNSDLIDSIMGRKDYSRIIIDFIISKEQVDPILITSDKNNVKPNWKVITNVIRDKYNSMYANRVVLDAKIRWYGYKEDWKNYTKYLSKKLASNDPKELKGIVVNHQAWEIFKRSTNRSELKVAIYWMEQLFKKPEEKDGAACDTYANLLYKIGRREEAIIWQKMAVGLEPENKEFEENLAKMSKGLETWPKN